MIREAVQSSQIAAIGYDPESLTLEIEFKASGRGLASIYQYFDVSGDVYETFRSTPSKGSFLAHVIKRDYRCQKVATILADGTEIPA